MQVIPELPVHFISHGGGPWPWMPQARENSYGELAAALAGIISSLPSLPKAVLMVSAHWEEAAFTVQASSNPGMIYDYYGFPEHTYEIHYSSPGSPFLAGRVVELLAEHDIPARIDPHRGYDHGMFAPMQIIRPEADIPVVQLSLKTGLDPLEHIDLGRALRPLRQEGILIIGSGLSYHNLRLFNPAGEEPSRQFDSWLVEVVTQTSGEERNRHLINWTKAPASRIAHPREEHLIPLMVAAGCAGNQLGKNSYRQKDFMGSLWISNFCFEPS